MIYIDNDARNILERYEGSCFEGWGPSERQLTKLSPVFKWKGIKMSLPFLKLLVEFFKLVYKEHQSEAQVRLVYSPKTGWSAQVLPQIASGASTKEVGDAVLKLEDGAMEAGTVHSHPSFSASQSSVDERDETGTNGVHITIGNVTDAKLSWHFRAYYRGIAHTVNIPSLIDFDTVYAADPDIYNMILAKLGSSSIIVSEAVPADWLDKVSRPAPVIPATYNYHAMSPSHDLSPAAPTFVYSEAPSYEEVLEMLIDAYDNYEYTYTGTLGFPVYFWYIFDEYWDLAHVPEVLSELKHLDPHDIAKLPFSVDVLSELTDTSTVLLSRGGDASSLADF